MNLRARGAVLGVLILGAALGCNNIKSGGSKKSSSTAPASTTPPTSSTTTNPPVTVSKAPTIATLSTSSCMVDGGAKITITGTNFAATGAGVTLVLFGTYGSEVRPTSDTQIDMSVPTSFKAGLVDVRVVNANGVGMLPQSFTYTPHAASVAFTPAVGHFELGLTGTKITLACKDFMPITKATAVSFGSKPAAAIALIDSKTLVAEVPDGLAAGPITITVTENGQSVSAANFLIQGPLNYADLTINEFAPDPSGMDCNNDGVRSSTADEFVEIVNTTANPIDLSYLTIRDATAVERHRFPNPTTLPPGGALVVFGAGCPDGFAERHRSGHAQTAASGDLGLNNTGDTIEIRALPGTAAVGKTIHIVNFTGTVTATSFTSVNDGKAITTNPATAADYRPHNTAPGAKGPISPGKRVDGTGF